MARLVINRPHYGYRDDSVITLEMDQGEAEHLCRVIQDRQSPLPLPQWLQDFVKVTR